MLQDLLLLLKITKRAYFAHKKRKVSSDKAIICLGNVQSMDEKFEEVVGRYLEKAIEVETETSMSQASSSMLFATACYNAQNILDKSSPNNLEANITEYIEMYEDMLRNSIEHYSSK